MKLFKVLSLSLLVATSLNASLPNVLMYVGGAAVVSEGIRHHDMETKKRGGKPGKLEEVVKDCATAMAGGVFMDAIQGKDMDMKSMVWSTVKSYMALKISKMPSLVELAEKIPGVRGIMCNENVGGMMRYAAAQMGVNKVVDFCSEMFKSTPVTK